MGYAARRFEPTQTEDAAEVSAMNENPSTNDSYEEFFEDRCDGYVLDPEEIAHLSGARRRPTHEELTTEVEGAYASRKARVAAG